MYSLVVIADERVMACVRCRSWEASVRWTFATEHNSITRRIGHVYLSRSKPNISTHSGLWYI